MKSQTCTYDTLWTLKLLLSNPPLEIHNNIQYPQDLGCWSALMSLIAGLSLHWVPGLMGGFQET